MLEGMRKAQQNWLGKVIITIMFGFLIVSFGVWGINDVFRGRQSNTVITAGKTAVPFEVFQTAFRATQIQLERRLNKPITQKEAQAMQLDQQVLGQLSSQAILDESARKLGLAASDDMVRQQVFSLPRFQSALGFDRAAFDGYLREIGMTDTGFIAEQRAVLMREQLGRAVTSGVAAPLSLQDLSFRLINEKRDVSYFILNEASAGDVALPTPEQLEATYNEHKAEFRAPEYRSFEVLSVTPEAMITPDSVSDEEARKAYDNLKATRYPENVERRTIQQILFRNPQQAGQALARLKAGSATFDSLAAEMKIAPESLSIGNLTRQEVLDPKIGDAAFSLAKDQVSDVIESRLGPVLIRVTRAGATGFDDVKSELKTQIARERSARKASDLRDEIEDMTANAKPFADIAKEKNLKLIQIKAVDKSGLDMSGAPVTDLPDAEHLVQAVFSSDIGVDNASLATPDGGYIWYQVTNVTPSRDRSLDEIRTQITEIWKRNEISSRLSKLAAAQVEQIKNLDDLKKAAVTAKVAVKPLVGQTRAMAPAPDFGNEGVLRVFSTPVGTPSSVANGTSRIVFLVTSATVPAVSQESPEVKQLNNQLTQDISNDLLVEYINGARKEFGVTVDQNVARRLFSSGGDI